MLDCSVPRAFSILWASSVSYPFPMGRLSFYPHRDPCSHLAPTRTDLFRPERSLNIKLRTALEK